MKKRNTVTDRMLNGAGFDWTAMPHRLVTRRNYESFLLMLARCGAESIILGSNPISTTTLTWMSDKDGRVTAKEMVWERDDTRIRIRLEFLNESDPFKAHIEIERVRAGLRKNYRCVSPELVTRVIREFDYRKQVARDKEELALAIEGLRVDNAEQARQLLRVVSGKPIHEGVLKQYVTR